MQPQELKRVPKNMDRCHAQPPAKFHHMPRATSGKPARRPMEASRR